MAKRGGKVHVAVTRRHYKGTEYKTTLLRRSYREDGRVKNETVGNLSHLEEWMVDGLRAMLAGRRLLDLDEEFEILRSLPHRHVALLLGVLRALDLERLISRDRCRERDLVVAMICQRLLAPCSKLSTTRLVAQTTLAQELSLEQLSEAELLGAMDWLLERQERIEKALARRHLAGEGFVLYDLSSSYLEGRHCELGAVGYSRDGKPGKPQISYGLVCAPEGQPVSIEVHKGNTGDPTTLGPSASSNANSVGFRNRPPAVVRPAAAGRLLCLDLDRQGQPGRAIAFAHEQPPASAEPAQMLCEGLRARGSSLSELLGTNLATPVKPISSCCFSRLRKSSPRTTADSASGRQICAIRTTGGVQLD